MDGWLNGLDGWLVGWLVRKPIIPLRMIPISSLSEWMDGRLDGWMD